MNVFDFVISLILIAVCTSIFINYFRFGSFIPNYFYPSYYNSYYPQSLRYYHHNDHRNNDEHRRH